MICVWSARCLIVILVPVLYFASLFVTVYYTPHLNLVCRVLLLLLLLLLLLRLLLLLQLLLLLYKPDPKIWMILRQQTGLTSQAILALPFQAPLHSFRILHVRAHSEMDLCPHKRPAPKVLYGFVGCLWGREGREGIGFCFFGGWLAISQLTRVSG